METKTYTPPASFIDLLMDAVFVVDTNAYILFASASCERIFGYSPQEMIGKNMFEMMVPEDRDRTRESVVAVMGGDPQLHFENRYTRKDGRIVNIMWSARWSPVERVRIGVARDITARKRAEAMQAALYAISEAAHAAEDLLALFERIHQIVGDLLPVDNFSVTLYDRTTNHLSFPYYVGERIPTPRPGQSAAGTLCAEVIRTRQALLLTPDNMDSRLKELQFTFRTTPLSWLGVPLNSQNGTIGVLFVKSYPGGVCYSEKDQELLQFVSTQIATAIERQQMQIRLKHMAQYDQLTALPNRGLLHDRLKVALSTARREDGQLSVLFIDLDKFKQVNDTLGHSAGDRLLQGVAQRLTQCLRESDTVARVGGDEFVVLLPRISSREQASVVAEKIRNSLSSPFTIDGHSLSMVPSIGIAHYPEHGDCEQHLLNYADKAMYAMKNGEARAV